MIKCNTNRCENRYDSKFKWCIVSECSKLLCCTCYLKSNYCQDHLLGPLNINELLTSNKFTEEFIRPLKHLRIYNNNKTTVKTSSSPSLSFSNDDITLQKPLIDTRFLEKTIGRLKYDIKTYKKKLDSYMNMKNDDNNEQNEIIDDWILEKISIIKLSHQWIKKCQKRILSTKKQSKNKWQKEKEEEYEDEEKENLLHGNSNSSDNNNSDYINNDENLTLSTSNSSSSSNNNKKIVISSDNDESDKDSDDDNNSENGNNDNNQKNNISISHEESLFNDYNDEGGDNDGDEDDFFDNEYNEDDFFDNNDNNQKNNISTSYEENQLNDYNDDELEILFKDYDDNDYGDDDDDNHHGDDDGNSDNKMEIIDNNNNNNNIDQKEKDLKAWTPRQIKKRNDIYYRKLCYDAYNFPGPKKRWIQFR